MTMEIRNDVNGNIIEPGTTYYRVTYEVNGTYGSKDVEDFADVLTLCRQVQQMAFVGRPSRRIEITWQETRRKADDE